MQILIVLLILFIAVAVALAANGISLSKKTFVCPVCGHKFKREWFKLLFLTHYENEYSVRCPECGKKYTNAVDD
ncbi:MAG: hypothetical protein IJ031_04480 [Oscillospiraceae bacterium]|nr:hypothetical protein [Oscillospiraceae bacterium]MBQ8377978.1 hypothetical protein [Oscillospiraceae bacterium]MBQ8883835.1 hypothetical protein [Oscillospiraceae bacterium]